MIRLLHYLPVLLLVLSLTTNALHAEDADIANLLAAAEQAVEAGQLNEAGAHYKHAIETATKAEGHDSENAIIGRMGYVSLLIDLKKLDEAEALARRQLDSVKRTFGEDSSVFAVSLSQLANILIGRNDFASAEPIARRVIEIHEGLADAEPENIDNAQRALAAILRGLDRPEEARAVEAQVKSLPQDDRDVAAANDLITAGDIDGGLRLFQESLTRLIAARGTADTFVAVRQAQIASIMLEHGLQFDAADRLYRQSIATIERLLGEDSPDLIASLTGLAALGSVRRDWQAVITAANRATQIAETWANDLATKEQLTALELESSQGFNYRLQIYAAWQLAEQVPDRMPEMMNAAFVAFQRASSSGAALALQRMAERRAVDDPEFAILVRRQQDLAQKVAAEARAAKARAAKPAGDAVFSGITETELQLAVIKAKIQKKLGTAAKGAGQPLSLSEIQALLRPGELVVVLTEAMPGAAGGLAMAISADNAWWVAIDTDSLKNHSKALRISLGATSGARGVIPAPDDSAEATVPAFDFTASLEIYEIALAPFNDALAQSSALILIPSPGLFDVPFTAAMRTPTADPAAPSALRDASWLIRSHALSVLPSLASLKALRALPMPIGTRFPLAGFGNPQFGGVGSGLPALPDTASELQHLAGSLKPEGSKLFLGADATEAVLKAGDFSAFSVLAFATHGLKAGELTGLEEPALALTPGGGEDGLLTASEVANLKLDADWVILSACNTASGANPEAEGFSGLARAFFYAGARSLLVSHWPVYSDAAVKLTTGALDALASNPDIGRAEALRRSMLAILDTDSNPTHWHPTYWAPFALLGDGS